MSKVVSHRWKHVSNSAKHSKHYRKSLPKNMRSNFNSLSRVFEQAQENRRQPEENTKQAFFEEQALVYWKSKSKQKIVRAKREVKQKETRRSRNDPIGRDYKCGCGKQYLSYPALFTHIRQKHGGKQLQGTLKTLPGANTKRGRPRKNDTDRVKHKKEESSEDEPIYRQASQSSTYSKHHLLPLNKSTMSMFSDFNDIMQGQTNIQEHLVFPKFIHFVKILKQQDSSKEIDSTVTIDQIFSIFLYNLADEVNPEFFSLLEETFLNLRACLNENHRAMLQPPNYSAEVFRLEFIQPTSKKQYCETHNCELLPLICQYFIVKHVPIHMKNADPELLSIIIHDFCIWLDEHKLTRIRTYKFVEHFHQVQKHGQGQEYSEDIFFDQ